MDCRHVARPFAMINSARSSRYIVGFFFPLPYLRARELARSKANSQTSNLPTNPDIFTLQHCRTASRRHRDQPYRISYRGPSPESTDSAMSRLRTGKLICQSLRWPSSRHSKSVRVLENKKELLLYCCVLYTAVLTAVLL